MLRAPRSTGSGNVPATGKPPGIKRSTLFRRRDTCSTVRRFDSRVTLGSIPKRRLSASNVAASCDVQARRSVNSEDKVRNLEAGYRPRSRKKINSRQSENKISAESVGLEKSVSEMQLEISEGFEDWEWGVSEEPKRSPAVSKLRSLQRERADLLIGLRSSLQTMLRCVRDLKNQRSR